MRYNFKIGLVIVICSMLSLQAMQQDILVEHKSFYDKKTTPLSLSSFVKITSDATPSSLSVHTMAFDEPVTDAAWITDDLVVAAGEKVHIVQYPLKEKKAAIPCSEGRLLNLASIGNNQLLGGTSHDSLALFDVQAQKEASVLRVGKRKPTHSLPIAINSDRTFAAVSLLDPLGADGASFAIAIYDINKQEITTKITRKGGLFWIKNLCWGVNNRLYITTIGPRLECYDVNAGKLEKLPIVDRHAPNRVEASPDGEKLLLACPIGGMILADKKGENQTVIDSEHWANFCMWQPQGKQVCFDDCKGNIFAFNMGDKKAQNIMSLGIKMEECMEAGCYSPNGRYCAMGSKLGVTMLYDFFKQQKILSVMDKRTVFHTLFNSSGSRMAIAINEPGYRNFLTVVKGFETGDN